MRRYFPIVLVIFLSYNCTSKTGKQEELILSRLHEMHMNEHYFKLNSFFDIHRDKLSEKYALYYETLIRNAFFDHAGSLEKLNELNTKYSEEFSEAETMLLDKTALSICLNTYNYSEAILFAKKIISQYKHLMDSLEFKEMGNDLLLFEAISNFPPQELSIDSDQQVAFTYDAWGNRLVDINIKGKEKELLFDTGFTFSCIKKSLAEELGLEIIHTKHQVSAATGEKTVCDVALIEELSLANITIKNAVFLVFEDEALSIPEFDFFLDGVIGFPIIRDLKEICFLKEGIMQIAKEPLALDLKNLAMLKMDPIIAVCLDNDTLPFYFDTGAAYSELYYNYYNKRKEQITESWDLKKQSFVGLGGQTEEVDMYITTNFQIRVNDNQASVKIIGTHTVPVFDAPEKVYGNLGNDFIGLFNSFTLNFECASIQFD